MFVLHWLFMSVVVLATVFPCRKAVSRAGAHGVLPLLKLPPAMNMAARYAFVLAE